VAVYPGRKRVTRHGRRIGVDFRGGNSIHPDSQLRLYGRLI
jgi:hypothetical protein